MKILFLKQKQNFFLKQTLIVVILFSLFVPFFKLDAAINKQINYQGKLTTSAGVAVANGTYNMEFALYTVASAGTAIWTETRTGANKVQVTSGIFSVLLGEVTALTGVDFNQTLYLGVNIGGTGTPGWDGEMTPRKKLGAVPAAVVSENAINIIGGAAGTLPYQSAANTTGFSAAGTAGQALVSGGTGAPTWFAPTAGSVVFAGASGILAQDNTNLFWDNTNKRLGIGMAGPTAGLEILAASSSTKGLRVKAAGGSSVNVIEAVDNADGVLFSVERTAGTTVAGPLILGSGSADGIVISSGTGATTKTIQSYGSDPLLLNSIGNNVGIGVSAATAVLHLKAGTTGANTAPLKFTSGALQTTAEAGAVEFLTDAYYGTITTGAARKQFAFTDSNITGTATNATNTAITDDTTTNATMYPTWVTAATGNLPQKVSSTKLSFNPSTGVLNTVGLGVTQTVTTTGALKGIVYTGAVNTNQTLSTEIPSLTLTTAGREWATGALATQREVLITQPTYSFVGASTITDAATVGIAGAPIKSTNASITNTHGLLIQAGAVSTATNSYGLTVNAQTGATNNYAAQFMGGNVGIGTAAPGTPLQVQSGSNYIQLDPTNGRVRIFNSGVDDLQLNATSGGLTVNGTINSTGNITAVGGALESRSSSGGGSLTAAGILNLWSDSGNAPYVSFTERGIGNRGVLGFAGGSGDLVYKSGTEAFSGGTERFRVTSTGNFGIGITPTAVLHLKAGTATANTAPLKFTSGSLLTTAEAGAVEFLTDAYYGTITTGAARKQFAFTDSNITGTATNATNTAITDDTTTNATMYPTWVTAATGNLPQKVSSTGITWNPSTGIFSLPGAVGYYAWRVSSSSGAIFGRNSTGTAGPSMGSLGEVAWTSGVPTGSADTRIIRAAAANIQLGATAVDTAPVAQTLSVQNTLAGGTADVAGANFTIAGSQGKGTGVGGSLIFQVAPAGSSGTVVNALATALTIDSTKTSTFAGNIALGTNSITMSGSIGVTGTRVTKGWFTDLEVTNAITGSVTGSAGSAATWTTARNLAGNSVNGSADVAFSNKFIVQGTTDAGLSGAQFLGALGTGILKNTTTTGVLSIATGADLPVMTSTVGGAVPTPPNNTTTFLRGDGTFATPTGGGTVTHTGGALTLNAVVLGAGTDDTKVSTGITTNGTAQLILGVNATTLGTLKMFGNTSGDVTLQPTAAAGTATVQTLPATTGTLVNRVTTANGVSASNTDGALSFTLGAITPTTVNGITFSGSSTPTLAVTGTTAVSGTNTGDQTTITGNAGSATYASATTITNDTTTNATMYPLWVTANTGNLPAKVSSTKLSFNPTVGLNIANTTASTSSTTGALITAGGLGVAGDTYVGGTIYPRAGTATAGTAPLKFTAGTNLTTTEAGAIEYNGTHLYFTAVNAGTRYQLDQQSVVNGSSVGNTQLYSNYSVSPDVTTSSSSYATILSGSYEQGEANQPLLIRVAGSFYSTVGTTQANFKILYDGVATSVVPVFINASSEHQQWAGLWQITGAATTGTKTVALQWARASGSGVVTMNSGDSIMMSVEAPILGTITGTGVANRIPFWTGANSLSSSAGLVFDSSSGNVGIGITGPTAALHLKAGTATANTAPLKFTSGSLLTTAEAGAVEFLTDAYYGTITTGAARKQFAFTDSNITGTATNATNIGITNDTTTNATMYPLWVTANTGNLPAKVSSTKLSFNPTVGLNIANTTASTSSTTGALITAGGLGVAGDTYVGGTIYPRAGTATAGTAPLKFTAGTNLTTTEAGAIEYNGTHLYFTAANAGTRYQLDQQSGGGATTALDNLASVAINTSLLPATDDTIDLGDNTHRWRDLYLGPQTLHIGTSTTDEGYLSYTTSTNVLEMQSTGNISLQPTSGNVGIGTTTPLLKLDVAGSGRFTGAATSVLTGSINTTASTSVVGVGTLFTTELVVGDRITVMGETKTVTNITDNTNLTVETAFTDLPNDTTPDKLAAILVTKTNGAGLVVNDLGYVGIGRTPSENVDLSIRGQGNGTAILRLDNGSADSSSLVEFYDGGVDTGNVGYYGAEPFFQLWSKFGGVPLVFGTSNTEKMRLDGDGHLGIGTISPTAVLQLKAGTATASTAPLKFTAGTNLGTTEAGAVEYDGTHLYFTAANAGTRYQLDQQSGGTTTLQSAYDATSGNTILTTTGRNIIFNNIAGTQFKLGMNTAVAPTVDMVNITNAAGSQGTVTSGVDGLQINFTTAAVGGSVDNSGLRLVMDPVGATEAGDTVEAIDLTNITNPTGLTTGVRIGTGYDVGIAFMDSGGQYAGFKAPADVTTTYTWTLPAADSAGCLQSNGSGTISIATCGDSKVETFTANGTYTRPANTIMVVVEAWGPGGGGGGGASLATTVAGGGAGGGGSYTTATFTSADVGTSVSVTVPAGGTGGAGGTNSSGTDGSAATADTSFGTLLTAYRGGGGAAGNATFAASGGGGGAGVGGAGSSVSGATGGTGGNPNDSGSTGIFGGGDGGPTTGNISTYGGGGGGGATSGVATNSYAGGGSMHGGAGGGGGGDTWAGNFGMAGGAGGSVPSVTTGGGGTAGSGGGSSGAVGGTGGAGAAGTGQNGGKGGGGGGGSGSQAPDTDANGGAGGAGGARGGGGGGGGAAHFVSTATGGTGGAGGRGEVVVWTIKGSGADLAEIYSTNDSTIKPGDVVSLDSSLLAGVKKSDKAYDKNAFGIVSTAPSLVMGTLEDENTAPVMIALAGRVPVKVNNENGSILPGDFLTPSSTPGVAMKATKAGKVIGQAMIGFDKEGEGLIVAFVKNDISNGGGLSDLVTNIDTLGASPSIDDISKLALANLVAKRDMLSESINLSEITADRIIAGLEIITPHVYADALTIDKVSSVKDAINLMSDTIFFGTPYFTTDTAGFAIIKKDEQSIDITFDKEYLEQPIVNANITIDADPQLLELNPETDADKIKIIKDAQMQTIKDLFDSKLEYLVANKSKKGFTIILKDKATQDISFSWITLAVKNAKTFTMKDPVAEPIIPPVATPMVAPTEPVVIPDPVIVEPVPAQDPLISTPDPTLDATPDSAGPPEANPISDPVPEVTVPENIAEPPPVVLDPIPNTAEIIDTPPAQ